MDKHKIVSRYLDRRLGGNPGINNYEFPADGFHVSADEDKISQIIASWRKVEQADLTALYVHVPFCPAQCTFCGFATTYGKGRFEVEAYLNAVRDEIVLWAQRVPLKQLNIGAVCIGGGTPNYLNASEFKSLAEMLREAFTIPSGIEWTVEIYPSNRLCDTEVLQAMVACGANRFSLAVQDFNDDVLAGSNRLYTAAEATQIGWRLRELGISDLNIDLMLGIPGQGADNAAANFAGLRALNPETVSLHPYSDVSRRITLRRNFAPVMTEQRQLYNTYRDWLVSSGWCAENKTDFLRTGCKTFEYEKLVTQSKPRLGLGVNALSNLSDWSYRNHGSLKDYEKSVKDGQLPIQRVYCLDKEFQVRRTMFYNLLQGNVRLSGLDSFAAGIIAPVVEAWIEHGLARREGDTLRFTEEGAWNIGLLQKSMHPSEMLAAMMKRR